MQVADYVREKAYHRFLERGAQHGNDLTDWLEAERSVPERAYLGYKPVRRDGGGFDNAVLQPGIYNWEDLFMGRRKALDVCNPVEKTFMSIAWIDEVNAPHTNGDLPDALYEPILFPLVPELRERNVTIQFHGPVIICWTMTLSIGWVSGLLFRFMRHPDTVCEEIPRIIRPTSFRQPYGRIYDIRVGQRWIEAVYNKEGWI